jgi:hypothetical protein
MANDSHVNPERRALPRRRTILRGRICYGSRYVISLDCGIRNLNERGAQLRISPSQPLPSTFALIHVAEGLAFDASLTWRRGDLAGVEFSAVHNLKTEVGDDLRPLRAIWAALAPA